MTDRRKVWLSYALIAVAFAIVAPGLIDNGGNLLVLAVLLVSSLAGVYGFRFFARRSRERRKSPDR